VKTIDESDHYVDKGHHDWEKNAGDPRFAETMENETAFRTGKKKGVSDRRTAELA
jgi:hypothetical protein